MLIYGSIDTFDVLFIYIDKYACEISNLEENRRAEEKLKDSGTCSLNITLKNKFEELN
jgi:hypothetical protein